MKLTHYTDYAVRVMIYLGSHSEELSSIGQIAKVYKISQNNLMKVVQDLGQAGYVETVRGRSGGVRLARSADKINLGELVRHTESSFQLADCPNCLISPACGLASILAEATRAFLGVLDKYNLTDLLGRRSQLRKLFVA